jgi:hypothetical protein
VAANNMQLKLDSTEPFSGLVISSQVREKGCVA